MIAPSDSSNDSAWPDGAPRAGDLVGGKYVCERVLGAGGMGVVVAARHTQLDQQVAIKVLLPAALRDPSAADRFLREARTAAAIKSDHVARVMDFGTLDSGAPYLVMEHLEGTDLKAVLSAEPSLPVPAIVDYAIQACEALFEAHRRGIVHRDLKPANLFLARRVDGSPLVKILDFGISKTVSQVATAAGSDASITKTGAVFGTPAYMSPEQLRSSKHVDHRTDIWSMGVTLFELVTGRLPFGDPDDGVVAMVAHILEDVPPRVSTLRPGVPPGLDDVVARCLCKEPSDRYASAAVLAEALAPFASAASAETLRRIERMSIDSLPFEATVRSDSAALSSSQPRPISSGWGRTDGHASPKRRPWGVVAVASAALLTASVAGWILGTRAKAPAAATAVNGMSSETSTVPSASAPASPAPTSSESPPAPAPVASSAEPTASVPASLPPRAAASTRATAAKPAVPKPAASAAATCEAGMVMSNGHCCRAGFEWKGGECLPGVAKGLQ
jgi:serine/threonine protein kinase